MPYDELCEGMTVFGADGSRLGTLVEKRPDCFVIEKGLVFKKDFFCDYSLVGDVVGDGVRLKMSGDALREQPPSERARELTPTRILPAEEELEATGRAVTNRSGVREELRASEPGYNTNEERRASEEVRKEGDLERREPDKS
ncbi:MAG: hypothetical protein QM765_00430 [Myxococcales bacterium]